MEENKNKEKHPYSYFAMRNKWIYWGAQEASSTPLWEQTHPSCSDWYVGEPRVGRNHGKPGPS